MGKTSNCHCGGFVFCRNDSCGVIARIYGRYNNRGNNKKVTLAGQPLTQKSSFRDTQADFSPSPDGRGMSCRRSMSRTNQGEGVNLTYTLAGSPLTRICKIRSESTTAASPVGRGHRAKAEVACDNSSRSEGHSHKHGSRLTRGGQDRGGEQNKKAQLTWKGIKL